MYLVDASVWTNFFRDKPNKSVRFFLNLLDENIPYGITNIIYQEILQDAATEKYFNKLNQCLSTQNFYNFKYDLKSYRSDA